MILMMFLDKDLQPQQQQQKQAYQTYSLPQPLLYSQASSSKHRRERSAYGVNNSFSPFNNHEDKHHIRWKKVILNAHNNKKSKMTKRMKKD